MTEIENKKPAGNKRMFGLKKEYKGRPNTHGGSWVSAYYLFCIYYNPFYTYCYGT